MAYQKFNQLIISALLLGSSCIVFAADALSFNNPWSPEAPPVAPVMAGYMTVTNNTDKDIAITAAKSPTFKTVEIHSMSMHDGMMHMVRQDKLLIPANKSVELKPGGLHIMFIKPEKVHKDGDSIKVTFTLSNKQTQDVLFPVKKKTMTMDHSKHKHMQH